jgi:hypothetical protein
MNITVVSRLDKSYRVFKERATWFWNRQSLESTGIKRYLHTPWLVSLQLYSQKESWKENTPPPKKKKQKGFKQGQTSEILSSYTLLVRLLPFRIELLQNAAPSTLYY